MNASECLQMDVLIDGQHVGAYSPYGRCVWHKGMVLAIKVESYFQVFDLFHSFYGKDGETQREFAARMRFQPILDGPDSETAF